MEAFSALLALCEGNPPAIVTAFSNISEVTPITCIVWGQTNHYKSIRLKYGQLFTKRADVLPYDIVKSRGREIGVIIVLIWL